MAISGISLFVGCWFEGLSFSQAVDQSFLSIPCCELWGSLCRSAHNMAACFIRTSMQDKTENSSKTELCLFNLITEEMAHHFCHILFDWGHSLGPTNTWRVKRDYREWMPRGWHYGEPCQKVSILPLMQKKTQIRICTHKILAK